MSIELINKLDEMRVEQDAAHAQAIADIDAILAAQLEVHAALRALNSDLAVRP